MTLAQRIKIWLWYKLNHLRFLWWDRMITEHRVRGWLFMRCGECGRPVRILGMWVGKHRDCMPF